jgi:hypothetical protein
MKQLGVCATLLVLAISAGMAPVSAQQKYTLGYGAGT